MSRKITKEQLDNLRTIWESDERKGFLWLWRENRPAVSRQYLEKVAKRQGWEKVAARTKRLLRPTQKPVAQEQSSPNNPPEKTSEVAEGDIFSREDIFARAYAASFNRAQAAREAGITPRAGSMLLKRDSVREKIREIVKPKVEKLGIDADSLINLWARMLTIDANEFSQYRVSCCPYCYSDTDEPLLKPEQYHRKKAAHDERRLSNPDLPEYPEYTREWWDISKDPVATCPNCRGEGIGRIHIKDTRKLSPLAKYMYCGVKETKDGVEIITLSKEKAAENLAKALGLFREKDASSEAKNVSSEELLRIFEERMAKARERNERLCQERGLEPVDVEVKEDD